MSSAPRLLPIRDGSVSIQAAKSASSDDAGWKTIGSSAQSAPKFCFSLFSKDGHCENRENCKFSHDDESYMKVRGLVHCPNDGCKAYMKSTSKQCRNCTEQYFEDKKARQLEWEAEKARRNSEWLERKEERERRKAELDAIEDHDCANAKSSWKCPHKTKFRLCKSCYQTEKEYVIRRN